jgi:hypothetical protein
MNKKGGIICIVMLLFVGLTIPPAMGSMLEADLTDNTKISKQFVEKEQLVTIDFIDYTGHIPVKKVMELPKTDYKQLRAKLKEIRVVHENSEESWNAQLSVLKEYNLITNTITYKTLIDRIEEKSKTLNLLNILSNFKPTPIINNSIFNAICAINFEMVNGTTYVFGLNTFMNLVGFDIISFHKGYTKDGIDTKGLLTRSNEPGQYAGVMFGFLGYWFGTKIGTGEYSDLVASGFTVITAWLPIPLNP